MIKLHFKEAKNQHHLLFANGDIPCMAPTQRACPVSTATELRSRPAGVSCDQRTCWRSFLFCWRSSPVLQGVLGPLSKPCSHHFFPERVVCENDTFEARTIRISDWTKLLKLCP